MADLIPIPVIPVVRIPKGKINKYEKRLYPQLKGQCPGYISYFNKYGRELVINLPCYLVFREDNI